MTAPTTEDREKDNGIKYIWSDYAGKVVQFILTRHKHAERIVCVNDSYTQTHSIKDSERMLRQNNQRASNVFMKPADKFPSNKDFHGLLRKP